MTVELKMRCREPVLNADEMHVRTWITDLASAGYSLAVELKQDGCVKASATATFTEPA